MVELTLLESCRVSGGLNDHFDHDHGHGHHHHEYHFEHGDEIFHEHDDFEYEYEFGRGYEEAVSICDIWGAYLRRVIEWWR